MRFASVCGQLEVLQKKIGFFGYHKLFKELLARSIFFSEMLKNAILYVQICINLIGLKRQNT